MPVASRRTPIAFDIGHTGEEFTWEETEPSGFNVVSVGKRVTNARGNRRHEKGRDKGTSGKGPEQGKGQGTVACGTPPKWWGELQSPLRPL